MAAAEMNRPPKRPKTAQPQGGVFPGGPGPKKDPDSLRAAMAFRLHGPTSHRKRKPTR
jgi:hypothetical protein